MSTDVIPPGALSTTRAAEYLATTEAALRQARHRGEGPPYVRIGRRIVYRLVDLNDYLAERVVGGDAS